MSKLNDESHQFRVINKRLLVRFKDRNPTALGGLDNIMKKTYSKIIELGDKIQEQQELLKKKSVTLNVLGKGLVALVSLKYNLSSLERLHLQQHFCTDLIEGNDQGWEETVEASLTFLLKTSLAKNYKVVFLFYFLNYLFFIIFSLFFNYFSYFFLLSILIYLRLLIYKIRKRQRYKQT